MPVKEYTISGRVKWIDVFEATPSEIEALAKDYGLNPYMVRDSMDATHLPKYEPVGAVQFLIVRYFNHLFNRKVASMQDMTNKIALFFNGDFLITIHVEKIGFLEVIHQKFVEAGLCATPAELVLKIIWYTLESYNDPMQRLSEQIDFYESRIMLRGITNEQMETLYYIKRQISICNKTLLLMQEPINRMGIQKGQGELFQDVQDQFLKMHTFYNVELEEVTNLMNLYLSFAAQKTNDVVKVLTIFSVFFMPLTFIAGIYGMNFRYMPELEQKWGYPVVLLFMLLTAACIYLWFRRKKWL